MSEILLVGVLALIALGAIAFPLLAGRETYSDAETLDADVERYRVALREGTLCEACRAANPPGSTYCAECGRALEDG